MKGIIDIFCGASGMKLNSHKLSFSILCQDKFIMDSISHIFPFKMESMDKGIKYLGFILKPNGYNKGDWDWILKQLDGILTSGLQLDLPGW